MTTIDLELLAGVTGGADDFGRCGPGSGMKWLGNIHTPQCAAHDAAVRGAEASGSPTWLAHIKALPLLPAAAASWARAKLAGQ